MMRTSAYLAIAALALSCVRPEAVDQEQPMTPAEAREYQIQMQRERLEIERAAIQSFIDSSEHSFVDYGNGLWVANLTRATCDDHKDTNDVTVIHDALMSLEGDLFVAHKAREFLLLRDQDVAWGIQQALLGRCPQDSLAVIIPAHLAHGVAGDLANVPPMSTVLCYLRILK